MTNNEILEKLKENILRDDNIVPIIVADVSSRIYTEITEYIHTMDISYNSVYCETGTSAASIRKNIAFKNTIKWAKHNPGKKFVLIINHIEQPFGENQETISDMCKNRKVKYTKIPDNVKIILLETDDEMTPHPFDSFNGYPFLWYRWKDENDTDVETTKNNSKEEILEKLKTNIENKEPNIPVIMGLCNNDLIMTLKKLMKIKCFQTECDKMSSAKGLCTPSIYNNLNKAVKYAEENPNETVVLTLSEYKLTDTHLFETILSMCKNRKIENITIPSNIKIIMTSMLVDEVYSEYLANDTFITYTCRDDESFDDPYLMDVIDPGFRGNITLYNYAGNIINEYINATHINYHDNNLYFILDGITYNFHNCKNLVQITR